MCLGEKGRGSIFQGLKISQVLVISTRKMLDGTNDLCTKSGSKF